MDTQRRLGVDIGGVIIDKLDGRTDLAFFMQNHLEATAVAGAFESVQELVRRFAGQVFLVSVCGQRVQDKTLDWLDYHRFYERTGLEREQVRFCRERRDKATICAELGITHFIDDRLEILGYFDRTLRHRYLFKPDAEEIDKYKVHLKRVIRVDDWNRLLAIIGP